MLKHLSIKNVAVIEKADIDFERGFNVLTGETGAGKSIIIDAINMLKGERASKSLIRAGEQKARVDGEFETDESSAEKIADIIGSEPETVIVISREMNQEGKNTIRVNGVPVNLTMLKSIGEYLVNIHGQHDNTSLLSVRSHIGFLDRFGGSAIADVLNEYKEINSEYHRVLSALENESDDEQEKLRKKDILSFQINELSEANLYAGEDEELESRKLFLDNASKICENTEKAYSLLYGGDEGNCHDLLWTAIKKLEDVSEFNEEINSVYSGLSEAGYLIEEKVRELKSFCDHTSFDRSEADEIEERLELIYTLKRKYGQSIPEILAFYENAQAELEKIETSDERINELNIKLKNLEEKRKSVASKLSDIRKKKAKELSVGVKKHLTDLNMARVDFEVSVCDAECGENGADDVEFLICTNLGEQKKPLAKIASGGELSRIMLAIKNVLAGYDSDKTVIFDEIDTGVSGSAAQKIGEKLYSMSLLSQVLCITHLPQIAALADNHYLIKKDVADGRTYTDVSPLDTEGRKYEIARTLGGAQVSVIAKENARQLLDEADAIKKIIKSKTEGNDKNV